MRKFLIASIVLIQFNAYSQASVYKPFCDNPSWTVVSTSFGISNYVTYQYQIDTIIGIHTYKKSKDINSSSFVLFRENISQKKVYQYDVTNSIDYLYIDFNLNLGDTFNLAAAGGTITVSSKDSLLINGCYHNKIVLSNNGGFSSYNFVEGILSEINPTYPFRWPGDPQVWTTCECHSGQFYYTYTGSPFTPFSCNLICSPAVPCSVANSINDINTNWEPNIYPNPTNSVLNITDNNNQLQNASIEIKNTLGQTVLLKPFSNQVDVSSLSSGIYFLTVRGKGSQKTVKIIKE